MKPATVVWVSGLPSAGKSTFAEHALASLKAQDIGVCLLDGDAVRACLVPKLGFSREERAQFYETLANLAALLARQGLVVLVAATAHERTFRERARSVAPAFVEVWVDTPLEECARRDTKGLYEAARSGAAHDVPGANEPYEPPLEPEVVAHGGFDADARARLLTLLQRK